MLKPLRCPLTLTWLFLPFAAAPPASGIPQGFALGPIFSWCVLLSA